MSLTGLACSCCITRALQKRYGRVGQEHTKPGTRMPRTHARTDERHRRSICPRRPGPTRGDKSATRSGAVEVDAWLVLSTAARGSMPRWATPGTAQREALCRLFRLSAFNGLLLHRVPRGGLTKDEGKSLFAPSTQHQLRLVAWGAPLRSGGLQNSHRGKARRWSWLICLGQGLPRRAWNVRIDESVPVSRSSRLQASCHELKSSGSWQFGRA